MGTSLALAAQTMAYSLGGISAIGDALSLSTTTTTRQYGSIPRRRNCIVWIFSEMFVLSQYRK